MLATLEASGEQGYVLGPHDEECSPWMQPGRSGAIYEVSGNSPVGDVWRIALS